MHMIAWIGAWLSVVYFVTTTECELSHSYNSQFSLAVYSWEELHRDIKTLKDIKSKLGLIAISWNMESTTNRPRFPDMHSTRKNTNWKHKVCVNIFFRKPLPCQPISQSWLFVFGWHCFCPETVLQIKLLGLLNLRGYSFHSSFIYQFTGLRGLEAYHLRCKGLGLQYYGHLL